jgi:hypothetical protein
MNGARPRPRAGWLDVLLPALLFTATTLYVAAQPRNLAPADESVYLYEAKRVLEGAVLYRDVFEITTPGWLYLMAALFRIFGVDLATARLAIAVLHGVTAVFLYAACRRLTIRPGLAWLPAVAYLVVSQPAWPIASQHWLGTLLTVLLLWICAALPDESLDAPAARPARWALWPGLVIGLLIGVHQQRGVLVGAGVVLWLIADRFVQRRHRVAQPLPSLLGQLVWLAIGAALVVVPMCIALIASAGFEPVWQALVVHPLFQYRGTMRSAWGQSTGLVAEAATYTFPRLLKYLPAILIVDLIRFAVLEVRRTSLAEARRLLFLLVFCATAVLSIAYFPDYIHIAFIAPLFFVAAAEILARAFGTAAQRMPVLRAVGWAVGALLLIACGWRLQHNLERSRASYPFTRQTAFGRVDLASDREARLYDTMRELMQPVPSRELFCYPIVSYLYLMLDVDNPTRYQFLLRPYTTDAQLGEVVAVLEQRQLPYIVAFPSVLRPDDPVLAYLHRDYEPMSEAGDLGQGIFRRK